MALALAQPAEAAAAASPEVARVQAELKALHVELSRARRARDRAALERIYAPEFRWVHGTGYADDRDRQIQSIMEAAGDDAPPPPDFAPPSEVLLLRDTVVLRRPVFVGARGVRLYSTHIYVRRGGRWQILHMQSTPLLPERTWIVLPPAALEAFAGTYRSPDSGTVSRLWVAEGVLRRQSPGLPMRRLRPVEANRFYDDIGTEYVFTRSPDGRVTAFSYRFALDGPKGRAERVD
jgi:hypothetical protein